MLQLGLVMLLEYDMLQLSNYDAARVGSAAAMLLGSV